MYISKIKVNNFRLIRGSVLDLENQEDRALSLLIGKNNSGKTSFIMLFDKFLGNSSKFNFDDFPVSLRQKIWGINEETDIFELSIRLIIEITYSNEDSLENLSEFILDLDPNENKVKILFECFIDKKKFLKKMTDINEENKKRFIKKSLSDYLICKIFTFDDYENLNKENRSKLIEKDKKAIDSLINYQVIHAKRGVSSSESSDSAKRTLSSLASTYYNRKSEVPDSFDDFTKSLIEMDKTLEVDYKRIFHDFLNKSKEFLNMDDLRVVSDLESKEIISNNSKVVYGDEDKSLPEYLNGLGVMNILYLLLQVEIKKECFVEKNKDINLLFIEEPEAHTHPQMQTVFIKKVKSLLSDKPPLQTFITSHSSHIVKNSNFKDVRYFCREDDQGNIHIKNLYSELEKMYENEQEEFKFLNQYLTISSAELFFADKVIFIEGYTEGLLLPYFIMEYDNQSSCDDKLSSQNISVIEVGSNAKAFRHFIDFLGIKALIITDIDTTKKTEETNDAGRMKITYPASSVEDATHTSNHTIRYFYNAPDSQDDNWEEWFEKLKNDEHHQENSKIKLAFQIKENGYHARSFEDCFISINFDNIKTNKSMIKGLKNINELDPSNTEYFELTKRVLDKKSDFASSLLWLALTTDISWNTPLYIKKGLEWIACQ